MKCSFGTFENKFFLWYSRDFKFFQKSDRSGTVFSSSLMGTILNLKIFFVYLKLDLPNYFLFSEQIFL